MNLADNIMLGSYSETALSGVAAVNQIQFILQQLVLGCGDSLIALSSQYWGQHRTEPIKKLSAIALRAALLFSILLFLIVSLFPAGTLHLFTADETIVTTGVSYLKIIRYTYIIFAISQILLATMRSVEKVRIAFTVSLCTLAVNCCINYVLIYGKFGAPQMGVQGAAIGTLTALQVMFLCIGILTSISLLLVKDPILSLYALSSETKALTNSFLRVLCVTCIGTAYQMPVLTGIIRGGGDTRFATCTAGSNL